MSDDRRRIEIRAGAATDTGRLRNNNQDSYILLPDRGLWMVADGMGGAQGGEVASQMAIKTIEDSYDEPGADALEAAFHEANHRIHEAAEDPDLRGMGTTSVAIAIVPTEPDPWDLAERESQGDPYPDDEDDQREQLLVVNVGDSRAYLYRDDALTQLTEDHSVVAELVREGRITEQEAEVHPQRNVITRVLGVYPEVQVDRWPVDPMQGDRYLLCSDGLFNEVNDDQITAVLRRLGDPTEAAAELVRLANEGGGRDNITVVVLDVIDDGGAAAAASAALADEPGTADSVDMAGFSTALDQRDGLSDDELSSIVTGGPQGRGKPSRKERRAARKERRAARREARSTRSRVTWRVVIFLVLLAAVIGGAFATIQWYGTSTYFVAFDGDEVAIFQGRPGGILWIDPELQEGTGIPRDEVPDQYLIDLDAGREYPSLARARRYVSNIERDIANQAEEAPTTTTTTERTTTTTAAVTTSSAN